MKNKILSLISLLVVSVIVFAITSCDSTSSADNKREDIIYVKYYGNNVIKYLGEHDKYAIIPMFAIIPTVNDTSVEFKRYHVIFRNDNKFGEFRDVARISIDNSNVAIHVAMTMYENIYTPLSGIQDYITIVKTTSSENQELGILAVRGVASKGSGYYKTEVLDKNGKLRYVVTRDQHSTVGDYYIYNSNGELYKNMPIAIRID